MSRNRYMVSRFQQSNEYLNEVDALCGLTLFIAIAGDDILSSRDGRADLRPFVIHLMISGKFRLDSAPIDLTRFGFQIRISIQIQNGHWTSSTKLISMSFDMPRKKRMAIEMNRVMFHVNAERVNRTIYHLTLSNEAPACNS